MEIAFADYAVRVERQITSKYAIPVITRKFPITFLGDLNGAEIHIEETATAEQRLFLLGHLFGHTVQWSLDPDVFTLAQQLKPPVPAQVLPAILKYEEEAAEYAQALLHEIGITDADMWLAQYSACDRAYLLHFYQTGDRREFRTFWSESVASLYSRPIPLFTPVKRRFRQDGIVI